MFRLFILFISLSLSSLLANASSVFLDVPDAIKVDEVMQSGHLNRPLLCQLILEETNLRRIKAGRPPLQWLGLLGEAARSHAEAMTEHGFFDHKNKFDRGQRTLSDRISRAGLNPSMIAENIAMSFAVDFAGVQNWMRNGGTGQRPALGLHTYRSFARSVVQQWMDSPGHRANIMNSSLRCIGIGLATIRDRKGLDRFYCVQDFYTPQIDTVMKLSMNRRRIGLL